MEDKKFKLSPSDFAYLYEECKCCYYLQIKYGIERPKGPFPAVFGALNTRLQSTLVGGDLQDLSQLLPKGFVESQEGFVESKIIPDTNIYIKGKYDLLVRLPDDTYLIVDFKISNPTAEKAAKYQTQLQSYHYAFEHPANGEAKEITKLGLIVMYPDRVKFAKGEAFLSFPPKWIEIDTKKDDFITFIQNIQKLLDGPVPPENPKCKFCEYRHLGEKYAHLFTAK